jgi:hypothetical protein
MPGSLAASPAVSGQQQGLVASPAALTLSEGDGAEQELRVRLAAPPPRGQQLAVAVSAVLQGHGDGGAVPRVSLNPRSLFFDASNWAVGQAVALGVSSLPDAGDQSALPAAFDLLLRPSGSGALRVPVWLHTRRQPTLLSAADRLVFSGEAALEAPPAGQSRPSLQLGQPLADLAALPPTAARLYSFSSSSSVGLDVQACSTDAPLQVALGVAGGAVAW